MTTPMTSGSFGDLLDPRFQKIYQDTYRQLPDMLGEVFTMVSTNGRNNMTWSNVGTLTDWDEFTGTIPYTSISQGYDVTMTPVEFAKGMQVDRKLYDDDQYHIMDQKPKGMAESLHRTRQKHGARIFNNANGVDTLFYSHSEGVALCSNSHTTTSGASTSTRVATRPTSGATSPTRTTGSCATARCAGRPCSGRIVSPRNSRWSRTSTRWSPSGAGTAGTA